VLNAGLDFVVKNIFKAFWRMSLLEYAIVGYRAVYLTPLLRCEHMVVPWANISRPLFIATDPTPGGYHRHHQRHHSVDLRHQRRVCAVWLAVCAAVRQTVHYCQRALRKRLPESSDAQYFGRATSDTSGETDHDREADQLHFLRQ